MSETKLIRPSQVTMAGWMIMVGSVIVVVTVFDQVAALRSVRMREAIEAFLSEPPGSGLGLTVNGARTILKALALVAAGCATAAGILGWQILRRDKAARLALTLLAAPLFLTGIVAGGFFSALVAAAALMLWTQPARDWFDGVVRPREAAAPVAQPAQPAQPAPDAPNAPSAPSAAPVGPVGPPDAPAPFPNFGVPLPAMPPLVLPRPAAVTWAAALTWVFSGLSMLVLVGSAVLFAQDPHEVVAQAREQQGSLDVAGVSDSMLIAGVVFMLVLFGLWAVIAAVLGYLVWRGQEWARIVLIVSGFLTMAVAVLGVVAGGITLPLLVASGVVVRLLLTPAAAAWCRRRRVMN